MNSKLVVQQLHGIYDIHVPSLLFYCQQIQIILKSFKFAEIQWIPREENRVVDFLANEAFNGPLYWGIQPIILFNLDMMGET